MLKKIISPYSPRLENIALLKDRLRQYILKPFGLFGDVFELQVRIHADKIALICGEEAISYGQLKVLSDRIAAGLQRDLVLRGSVVAICASNSIEYLAAFIGILKAGAAVSPLSASSTPAQLCSMLRDSGASHLFIDKTGSDAFGPFAADLAVRLIAFSPNLGAQTITSWLPSPDAEPESVRIEAEDPFNLIYSSGTTGTPKGIVQPHSQRWSQLHLLDPPGYGPDAVAIISTPLYSNTTLVSVLPALAGGGTLVLMPRFDARRFLELSQRYHVTHAMLVPVQYRRILDLPDFDSFNLSSYVMKYATSAPFSAFLKAEVLRRWPGGLVEYYGMTEGGGACMLVAHDRPDKLHTVGQAIAGHQMRVINEEGEEVPSGRIGEVVGRSAVMMTGYHNQPDQTRDAEWYSPAGERYIRTGDIGAIDDEGFFTLIGRKKDVIISGGINIYPVDLEAALQAHPAVFEAAVIGVASLRWGETPIGFVTLHQGQVISASALKDWANERLGKMQRLADVRILDELPRNQIGKIIKRALQQLYQNEPVE